MSQGANPAPVPSPKELRARLREIESDLRAVSDPGIRRDLGRARRVVKDALATHALHGRL